MMHNLLLEEGDIVQIESVSLPVATFSKFKPQSPDFLEITNQKAVLENALRNFACLTTGDLVAIKYNSKIYELCVLETKPGNAVSIIECDMNVRATYQVDYSIWTNTILTRLVINWYFPQVEFDTPVGYQEPDRVRKVSEADQDDETKQQILYDTQSFVAFSGEGNRLDGKKKKCDKPEAPQAPRVCIHLVQLFVFNPYNFHFFSFLLRNRFRFVASPITIIRTVWFVSIVRSNRSAINQTKITMSTMTIHRPMVVSKRFKAKVSHWEKGENDCVLAFRVHVCV